MAAAVSTRKVRSTQPRLRTVGGRAHHRRAAAPWWMQAATMSIDGTATKKNQEIGTTAAATSRVAHGESSRAATTVKRAAPARAPRSDGRVAGSGQAARTSAAITTVRKARKQADSTANPAQEGW
ncbi:MAG: hypothetical protein M5U14_03195 [Acidimicrobiia bacterium]|nr:hypothetical protein [Acidimicrobiia bacterium]